MLRVRRTLIEWHINVSSYLFIGVCKWGMTYKGYGMTNIDKHLKYFKIIFFKYLLIQFFSFVIYFIELLLTYMNNIAMLHIAYNLSIIYILMLYTFTICILFELKKQNCIKYKNLS